MKRYRYYVLHFVLLIALSACQSDWDDHYGHSTPRNMESLMGLIDAESDLAIFAQALRITGVDSLLSSDQTYTVWAPKDAALVDFDLNDVAAVTRMVNNHIARFSNPTSTTGRITMLNGKTMTFSNAKTFNGITIVDANLAAQNGLLHKLEEQISYKYNVRELLDVDTRFSKLSDFIAQFDEKVYDEQHSTTHDSVFVDYNPLLEDARYGIGDIGDEDSLFTMIVPTDDVWVSELARVAPAFRTYNADEAIADSIQQIQTGQAILGGLTFRGIIDENADSLVSVTGQVIKPVKEYLSGYERIESSNGVVYVAASTLNTNDICVWNHILITEAEAMDSRVPMSGSVCYIRNTDVHSLVQGVSEDSYLEVSSGNVDGGVTFEISNPLATKYDVYVDFVNPIVNGENLAEEKTKVVFQLMYRGDNGRNTAKNANTPVEICGVDEEGNANPGIISVKAFSEVELPVADFYDGMWKADESHSVADIKASTTVKVSTKVTATDARNGYVRKFRIDRVRFVPVTN